MSPTSSQRTDPAKLIGGANDYQLRLSSCGGLVETAFTRAHVSFVGQACWSSPPCVVLGSGSANSVGAFNDMDSVTHEGGKTWSAPQRSRPNRRSRTRRRTCFVARCGSTEDAWYGSAG